jgi:alkylation response protein AidB-like acyl-CoA dehydrogenase
LSFTSSIIVIEELAKIDPSVSVMVDVQNTLINNAIKKWGTPAQQQECFPKLSQDTLASFCLTEWGSGSDVRLTKANCVSSF